MTIEIDTWLSSQHVARMLDCNGFSRPLPCRRRLDHDPEFTGLAMGTKRHHDSVTLALTQLAAYIDHQH